MRINLISLSVLFVLFTQITFGQLPTPNLSSLGQFQPAASEEFGSNANPASLFSTNSFCIQAYGKTQLRLASIQTLGIDFTKRWKNTSAGISIQHFQPPGYRITALKADASRLLTKNIALGIRFGGISGDLDEYGSFKRPLAGVGMKVKLNSVFNAGFQYQYAEKNDLPINAHSFAVGVQYQSSPEIHILGSVHQNIEEEIGFSLGLKYEMHKKIHGLVSINSTTKSINFGLDYRIANHFKINLAGQLFQSIPMATYYGVQYHSNTYF